MAFFENLKKKFVRSEDKDKYLSGLSRSKKSFGDRLRSLSNNFHGIDDDLLEQIMIILLESDVGVVTAQKIVDRFEENARDIKNYDSMEDYFIAILKEFYEQEEDPALNLDNPGTNVILMVGVNGSGKTTTAAKLIKYYKDQGKSVAAAAADTFRAGAVDQLQTWTERLEVPCIIGRPNQDPSSVLVDACRKSKEENVDILVADTAGRLQNKANLMKELSKMARVTAREIPGAPHEVWLVLDATTGQNGILQAKEFMEATNVTGIILTKMDGTAKGGVVMAIRDQLHLPVRFLGLGEKPEDLRPFDLDLYLMGITKGMENDAY